MIYYDTIESKLGQLVITATDTGVSGLKFAGSHGDLSENALRGLLQETDICRDPARLAKVKKQLTEYFEGRLKRFDLPLDLIGTPFQLLVWDILLTIPYGEVWSYEDVAVKAGGASKVRAIGGAVGRNPLPIIVPCHRVIGKNGKLTGFSAPGGIELKRKILEHEGVHLSLDMHEQISLI